MIRTPFSQLTFLVARHAQLVLPGLGLGVLLASLQTFRSAVHAVSMVTAYASIVLLTHTLIFGPLHVFKGGRPMTSASSRRYLGVWSGVLAIIHVAAGLNVHMGGRYSNYFVEPPNGAGWRAPLLNAFGAANYLGSVATLLVITLMVLSNDHWVRSMGAVRWKRVQRSVYWLVALAFAHGLLYQALEERRAALVVALGLILSVTVVSQFAGRVVSRRRKTRQVVERNG